MTPRPRDPTVLRRAALGAALALWSAAHAQATPQTPAAPLTLDAALALLSGAPSVTQAQLAVQVAQRNLDAARTALGLTVSVNGNAAYTGPGTQTAADGTTTALSSSLSGSAGVNVSLGLLPWSGDGEQPPAPDTRGHRIRWPGRNPTGGRRPPAHRAGWLQRSHR